MYICMLRSFQQPRAAGRASRPKVGQSGRGRYTTLLLFLHYTNILITRVYSTIYYTIPTDGSGCVCVGCVCVYVHVYVYV